MTTTADLVLDHVRRHGRIADLAALARDAGRPPKAVLDALRGLKARGQVAYVLWDMPIRVVGEPVVHRDIKPANEVEKGELMAEAGDVEVVWPDVVQAEEAPNTVAKGDMDDAAEQPAEVVHRAPRRRRGLTAALLEHLRTRPGERPDPATLGFDERQLGVTLAHLRKRGVLTYPRTVGGRGCRLDWSTIKLLDEVPAPEPAEESLTAPGAPSLRSERGGERARAGRSPAPGAHHEPSDNRGRGGAPAAPGVSSRPSSGPTESELAAEAVLEDPAPAPLNVPAEGFSFVVVDRKQRVLAGFRPSPDDVMDACAYQRTHGGHGVVRTRDGAWISRMQGGEQAREVEEEPAEDGDHVDALEEEEAS